MKKAKRRIFAFFVATMLLFSPLSSGISALADVVQFEKSKNKIVSQMDIYESVDKHRRVHSVIEKHIKVYMNNNAELKIARAKPLQDFCGNGYTLFELEPTGYIIYHNDSAKFVEYSSSAPSPYQGKEDELYYAGIMEYYEKNDNELRGTVKTEAVILAEQVEGFIEISQTIQENLTDKADTQLLNYIEGDLPVMPLFNPPGDGKEIVDPQGPSSVMVDFFTNLKTGYDIGYRPGGACGYIAANLILGYLHCCFSTSILNNSYANWYTKKMNGPLLTNRLLEVNGQDIYLDTNLYKYPGTDAFIIKNVITAFAQADGFNYSEWKLDTWPFPLIFFAQNALDAKYPVALFGIWSNIASWEGHAVVAYDYEETASGSIRYRVHCGWENRQDVMTDVGIVGSLLIMQKK